MQLHYNDQSGKLQVTLNIQIREVRVGTASIYRPYLDLGEYICNQLDAKGRPLFTLWANQKLVDDRYLPGRAAKSMTSQGDNNWTFDLISINSRGDAPKVATFFLYHSSVHGWYATFNNPAVSLLWCSFLGDLTGTDYGANRYNGIKVNLDTSMVSSEFIVKAVFKTGTSPSSLAKQIIDQVTKGD